MLSDLLLAYGLGLFGAANLLILWTELLGVSANFHIWAPLITRLVGAGAILWAAWHPDRRSALSAAASKLISAYAITLLGVSAIVLAASNRLPLAVSTSIPQPSSARLPLEAHPVLLIIQLVLMIMYWAVAWGFARPRRKQSDALTIALATGFVLAGFSRLNFFLYPSLYTDIVDTGDFLRVAWYLSLLVGAAREIESYWTRMADAAVTEERRRTARELHDGLMQELSFIHSRISAFAQGQPDALAIRQVTTAAERALQESRLAVQTLSVEGKENLETTLRRSAEDIVGRAGATVQVENPLGVELPPHVRLVLSRIIREASSNAVRHGKARNVSIHIERQKLGGVRITVTDDGGGFDVDANEAGGFGLRSMRERTHSLDGELNVTSSAGEGTTVVVTVPGLQR